jgi:extracellular matrix regulatory protein A
MSTELVHLGFSNIVAINKVMAIVSPNSAPAKRLHQEAKSKGLVIDVTNGRRTKAMLIMENAYVVLAAIAPETIANRVSASRKFDSKELSEEKGQAE